MVLSLLLAISAVFSGAFFLLSCINLWVYRRIPLQETRGEVERVSILIPMRNEAAHAISCLETVRSLPDDNLEILVLDDHSTDGTLDLLHAEAEKDARIRILEGAALPEGWTGKNWACHQLAARATGQWLLFLDADVQSTPYLVSSLLAEVKRRRVDLLSAVPRQITESYWERIAVPLMLVIYATFIPAWMIRGSRRPAFTAANGQVLLVSRAAYDAARGHAAAPRHVVDDVALARRVKSAGYRIALGNGALLARCRMYTDFSTVWMGFTKNLYPGLGFSDTAVFGLIALLLLVFLAWIPGSFLVLLGDPTELQVGLLAFLFLAPLGTRVLVSRTFLLSSRSIVHCHGSFLFLISLSLGSRAVYQRPDGAAWKGRMTGGMERTPS